MKLDEEKIKTFGAVIKALRKEFSVRQQSIAKKLEITQNFLSKVETGKVEIKFCLFLDICELFSLDPKDFMTKKENK